MSPDAVFCGDWLGLCSECGQTKTFVTEHARDLWELHHTHDAGQS